MTEQPHSHTIDQLRAAMDTADRGALRRRVLRTAARRRSCEEPPMSPSLERQLEAVSQMAAELGLVED